MTQDTSDPALLGVDQAVFQLRRLWSKPHLSRRLSDQGCGPSGRPIHLSNLLVINSIARIHEESDADATVGRVAERLDVDPSTASRLVADAIAGGFVSRTQSSVDARRASLALTEAGARVKEVADGYRRTYVDGLMSGWTEAERAEFARLLGRFTEAAVRTPPDLSGIYKIFEAAGEAQPDAVTR